jgi:hypothetical protein
MTRNARVVLAALVAILLVSSLAAYYEATRGAASQAPTAGSVTGTGVSSSDTFFATNCSITGIGGFELLVASDSGGAPVTGEVVNAVDHLGCNSDRQVVYLDEFAARQGGWLTPVFPSQATPGGQLNFTVSYQGKTYNFSAEVPPIGTSCVTLHVPSGSVTTKTVMNGSGSYCA